jgi:hypothetical protein
MNTYYFSNKRTGKTKKAYGVTTAAARFNENMAVGEWELTYWKLGKV